MHILSLTRVNSLTLKFRKKTEKIPWIKSILFLILHLTPNFYSIWTTNNNTVVSHRKENLIENDKQRIFFNISYFILIHIITMHYYMRFGKDNMNTFLYIHFLALLNCGWKFLLLHSKIPKAFWVFMLGKKTKSVLESQMNFKNSLWPFFQIWFSFSTIGEERGENWIKFEFSFIVTSGKSCEKTKSKFKKTARENFLNLSGFPKHSLFFS